MNPILRKITTILLIDSDEGLILKTSAAYLRPVHIVTTPKEFEKLRFHSGNVSNPFRPH